MSFVSEESSVSRDTGRISSPVLEHLYETAEGFYFAVTVIPLAGVKQGSALTIC